MTYRGLLSIKKITDNSRVLSTKRVLLKDQYITPVVKMTIYVVLKKWYWIKRPFMLC